MPWEDKGSAERWKASGAAHCGGDHDEEDHFTKRCNLPFLAPRERAREGGREGGRERANGRAGELSCQMKF